MLAGGVDVALCALQAAHAPLQRLAGEVQLAAGLAGVGGVDHVGARLSVAGEHGQGAGAGGGLQLQVERLRFFMVCSSVCGASAPLGDEDSVTAARLLPRKYSPSGRTFRGHPHARDVSPTIFLRSPAILRRSWWRAPGTVQPSARLSCSPTLSIRGTVPSPRRWWRSGPRPSPAPAPSLPAACT